MAYQDLADIFDPQPDASPPAEWGDQIRDNFEALLGALSILTRATGAQILTSQTTTSTSYTDLASTGPTVEIETGDSALVIVGFEGFNSTAGSWNAMSYDISGATTAAANDNRRAFFSTPTLGAASVFGVGLHLGTLNPGTNRFRAKYKVSGNTGTFAARKLLVFPLGSI